VSRITCSWLAALSRTSRVKALSRRQQLDRAHDAAAFSSTPRSRADRLQQLAQVELAALLADRRTAASQGCRLIGGTATGMCHDRPWAARHVDLVVLVLTAFIRLSDTRRPLAGAVVPDTRLGPRGGV